MGHLLWDSEGWRSDTFTRAEAAELYVKMTSRFLSVWLKDLVPLLDKVLPLFALQRQLFIVNSSDGWGQRSETGVLCFSWVAWAPPQDLRPCKVGRASVWFCNLRTSTNKHAAFHRRTRSSFVLLPTVATRDSHQSGAEIEILLKLALSCQLKS